MIDIVKSLAALCSYQPSSPSQLFCLFFLLRGFSAEDTAAYSVELRKRLFSLLSVTCALLPSQRYRQQGGQVSLLQLRHCSATESTLEP